MIGDPLLNRLVRIKLTADCESYWNNHHDRRADCIELRDQRVEGRICQGSDGRYFVCFEGRNGHWLPIEDLEFLENSHE